MREIEIKSAHFDSFTLITQTKHAYQSLLEAIGSLHITIEKLEKLDKDISFEVTIKKKT